MSYRLWLLLNQFAPNDALLRDAVGDTPVLAIHLHLAPGAFTRAIGSVLDQSFTRWELHVTSSEGGASVPAHPGFKDARVNVVRLPVATRALGLKHVLEITHASHIIPLDARFTLTSDALHAYASAIGEDRVSVFYGDQDERDRRGRRTNPWLKPGWDEDMFLAQDYLSAACAIPTDKARAAGVDVRWPDELSVGALLLRLLVGTDALPARHVAFVTTTTSPRAWSSRSLDRAELVNRATGLEVTDGGFGTLILKRTLLDPPPRVSVIVPTRDRMDLLRTCVEGLLHRTDYPDIELVIADNDSADAEILAYFERCRRDPRVRVVHWPHSYNYSAINNFAIAQVNSPYVCLLNNDTEIVDPSWLRVMMAQAVRPEVGAVGARLLYPDHSVQHAGVVIGMGNAAGHAHRGLPKGDPGWFAQALITRTATAVTAACLVVARAKFDAVSGLDEENLAIAYNDVDLCLKLRKAGWRNIYAAQAVLIHHESKSRGLDFAPEHHARYMRELAVLQARWETVGFQDPTHHRKLDPTTEQYRLKL